MEFGDEGEEDPFALLIWLAEDSWEDHSQVCRTSPPADLRSSFSPQSFNFDETPRLRPQILDEAGTFEHAAGT